MTYTSSTNTGSGANANANAVISVSQLNRQVRQRLESGFPLLWVSGEISNLTIAASGHAYFSLKDDGAQVRCVMFRSKAQLTGFRLANGVQIEARVLVSLYEPRGDFQLNVESLRRAGQGNLYERFLQLKAKLEGEGLFDPERKRPLPAFPRRIGIITSPQAAALRDVLTTLARRAPQIGVVLYPTLVQGEAAPAQIAEAIHQAGARSEQDGCELLLVCRGGGSLEDLWAFNEEVVVRAVAACPLPVISGVGHETDVTLIDFVADRRAPTPTAAAELAAPAREELRQRLFSLGAALGRRARRRVEQAEQRLDHTARRLKHPAERLADHRNRLATLARRLGNAAQRQQQRQDERLAALQHRLQRTRPDQAFAARWQPRLDQWQQRLQRALTTSQQHRLSRIEHLAASLEHLNPDAILGRGFSIVATTDGRIVTDATQLAVGSAVEMRLAHGQASAAITKIAPSGNKDADSVVTDREPS